MCAGLKLSILVWWVFVAAGTSREHLKDCGTAA